MSKSKSFAAISPIPHSWPVRDWPSAVFPNSATAGAWLTRSRRDELINAGALIRVGHQLAVIGPRYIAWLERQAEGVRGYSPNNPTLRRSA